VQQKSHADFTLKTSVVTGKTYLKNRKKNLLAQDLRFSRRWRFRSRFSALLHCYRIPTFRRIILALSSG